MLGTLTYFYKKFQMSLVSYAHHTCTANESTAKRPHESEKENVKKYAKANGQINGNAKKNLRTKSA